MKAALLLVNAVYFLFGASMYMGTMWVLRFFLYPTWRSLTPDNVGEHFGVPTILATKFFKRNDAPFGVAGFSDLGAVRIIQSDPDVKMLLDPYVKQRPRGLVFRPQVDSLYHRRGFPVVR